MARIRVRDVGLEILCLSYRHKQQQDECSSHVNASRFYSLKTNGNPPLDKREDNSVRRPRLARFIIPPRQFVPTGLEP